MDTKIIQAIMFGFLLASGGLSGHADALEKTVPVKSPNVQCEKAVIRNEDDKLVADFLIKGKPSFNTYKTFSGETPISADLQDPPGLIASWLIVVDTSDPKGRPASILREQMAAARLCTLMSEESKVALYSISRDYKFLTDDKEILPIGRNADIDVCLKAPKNALAWTQEFAPFGQLFQGFPESALSNTNLWIGLVQALRQSIPSQAYGEYAHMPKGIILLSDGVDESPTSKEDMQLLIEESKKLGIPIHTIGFPHKDNSKQYSEKERHKGFANLQHIAVQTGGYFLSWDTSQAMALDTAGGKAALTRLLSSSSVSLVRLTAAISQIHGGNDLTVRLQQGQKHIASFNVNQDDIAFVLGDYYLNALYNAARHAAATAGADERATQLKELGKDFLRWMPQLPIRAELFNCTTADEPFARRAKQILALLDEHPELKESAGIETKIGICLADYNAALPEVSKQETAAPQPIIINNSSSGYGDEDASDEESLQDWVWWSIGVGGTAFAILFFWLVIKLVNRGEARRAEEAAPAPGATAPPAGPTLPVLASLANTANPAQSWVVCKTSCTVGRRAANDICLPYPYISGLQFILTRSANGQWRLKNAGTVNATLVNGKKTDAADLHSGDIIRVADFEMEFKIR